jgi:hypothetical protein
METCTSSGSPEVIHVAWGASRSGSVRDALRRQGCGARVIALTDTLSLGPIDTLDPGARAAWFEANTIRDDEPVEAKIDHETSWIEATADDAYPVYWVCLADAVEHAAFLAFASRMAGRPFDLIDATGLDLTTIDGISPIWSLGLLRPEDIVASGLSERRRPFSGAESDAAVAAWSRLQRENAPVRIVRDGRLVSVPLTQFDAALIGQAGRSRELLVKLIARTLHHLSVEVDPPGQGCSHELLFARIVALGEAGTLEVTGAGPGMRDYEVRLPDTDPLA